MIRLIPIKITEMTKGTNREKFSTAFIKLIDKYGSGISAHMDTAIKIAAAEKTEQARSAIAIMVLFISVFLSYRSSLNAKRP